MKVPKQGTAPKRRQDRIRFDGGDGYRRARSYIDNRTMRVREIIRTNGGLRINVDSGPGSRAQTLRVDGSQLPKGRRPMKGEGR